jgi:hypothetical protein
MKNFKLLMVIAIIGLMVSCKETTTKTTDVTVTDTTAVDSASVGVLSDTIADEDLPTNDTVNK